MFNISTHLPFYNLATHCILTKQPTYILPNPNPRYLMYVLLIPNLPITYPPLTYLPICYVLTCYQSQTLLSPTYLLDWPSACINGKTLLIIRIISCNDQEVGPYCFGYHEVVKHVIEKVFKMFTWMKKKVENYTQHGRTHTPLELYTWL
jgi:hypothetical protein